eukprot:3909606-Prymnesium_polylepis.1
MIGSSAQQPAPTDTAPLASARTLLLKRTEGWWRAALLAAEEQAARANVDHLEDVLTRPRAGQHNGNDAEHRQAAVPHLRSRREATLAHQRGEQAVRLLQLRAGRRTAR